MTRLFIAIDMPEEVKERLKDLCLGVRGARWVKDQQFHLTLRFIGEVDGPTVTRLESILGSVKHRPFELSLADVGCFPPRGHPRVLWAGVRGGEELTLLRNRIESVLRRCGMEPERRRFTPHVTLARLHDTPLEAVLEWITQHASFSLEPFLVERFILYISHLGRAGSVHVPAAAYPLESGKDS